MPRLVARALAGETLFAGEQPVLSGDGLVLRPWRETDWPVLVRAYQDPEIQRWHVRTLDEDEARGWADVRAAQWRERRAVDWAIVDDDVEGRVLGRVGIRRFELEQALGEVAYWVLPEARGAGVTLRALTVLCEWAFAEQGLHRLELCHPTDNRGSCRVAERTGFRLEGVKRREVRHADGWHDMHLHARLADDAPAADTVLRPDL